jgi:hypothetical protein
MTKRPSARFLKCSIFKRLPFRLFDHAVSLFCPHHSAGLLVAPIPHVTDGKIAAHSIHTYLEALAGVDASSTTLPPFHSPIDEVSSHHWYSAVLSGTQW